MWGLFSQLCSENHYFLQNMKKVIFKNCAEKCKRWLYFFWISQSVSYFMGILHFLGFTWLILIIFKLFILVIIKFKVFLFSGIFHSPFQLSLNKFFTQTFYLPVNPVCGFFSGMLQITSQETKNSGNFWEQARCTIRKKKEYCNRIEILQWK